MDREGQPSAFESRCRFDRDSERPGVARREPIVPAERTLLEAIIENTRAHLAYLDVNLRFVMVNSAYAEGSGYSVQELVGRNHFDLFPHAENQAVFERVRDTGEPVTFDARPFEFPDQPERGTTYWDWSLVPVKEGGEVRGLVLSLADVTEQERSRQALRRYADRLRGLHEIDQAILAARSVDEIAEAALRQLPDLFDCVCAEVMLYDLDAQRITLLAVHTACETCVGKGWHGPIDESWADVLQTLGRGVPYILADVQQAPHNSPWRQALQTEQVRMFAALPLIADGCLIGSFNLGMHEPEQLTAGQMEIAHELATQLAIGIHQARLRERVQRHADELEKEVRRRTAALQASRARLRAIFDTAAIGIAQVDVDGRFVESNPVLQAMLGYTAEELEGIELIELSHPADAEADAALFQELASGERDDYGLSKRYIRKSGEPLWGNLYVSLVRDPSGEPSFAVVLLEDITAWREAQQALVQSEKLALTGRLAASIAHEINNPLQAVIGCLDLARESLIEGEQSDALRMLQIGAEELQRAAAIVAQLRDLNRPSELMEREESDIKELLEHARLLMHKKSRQHDVDVLLELDDDLPWLVVAPDQVQQVFMNLMLNAIEAMPGGGRLLVRAIRSEEPRGVQVTFADTGHGISPNDLVNVFDPFFTTKREGLGLGLYVTKNIIDLHGGHIDVESQLDKGTTFTVWLPTDSG